MNKPFEHISVTHPPETQVGSITFSTGTNGINFCPCCGHDLRPYFSGQTILPETVKYVDSWAKDTTKPD